MKNSKNIARYLFALTLILIGLISCNMLPITLPERAAQAATRGTVLGLPSQPVATAVTNGKVAFVANDPGSKSDIYTMNPDRTDLTRLTFSSESDTQPAWSPDGTKIVFVRFSGPECYPYSKGGEIFVMNADGSDQRRLTQSTCERSDHSPTWSPDGVKIAFVNSIPPKNGLYVMNANGSDQTRIITPGFVFGSPAWSPDGSKLAVEAEGRIFLINVDGSNPTAITPTSSDPDFDPVWSPDGSKLLFSKWDCPYECWGPLGIWVVNADGSNHKMLTGEGASGQAWSPDGSKILFSKWSGRSIDLFAMNPDGSNVQNITNTDGKHEWDPSWQALLASTNPIDDPTFFVRQHYADFLNREPDQVGSDYWTNEITSCGLNELCIHERRIGVSGAFFVENEFQETGYVVYRMHRAAHGVTQIPCIDENGNSCGVLFQPNITFSRFLTDRAQLIGGPGLPQSTINFANNFVQRPEFLQTYPATMTPAEFVNKLFDTAELTGPENAPRRQAAIEALINGSRTRAQVLLDLIEISEFKTREYNFAFVLMQYFGYLRRDPDLGGYSFWLNVLNNRVPGNYRSMICAFLTSTEYQQRFGSAITRTNMDCRR
jgi:Tol biopolymer transport system component